MEFNTEEEYVAYHSHPLHVNVVQSQWLPEVEDFLEINYEPCELGTSK